MHGGSGKKPQLNLSIRRFEPFPCPATRTNRDQGLVDRPGRSLFIDFRIQKRSNALLLVRFESEINRKRHHDRRDQDDADQVAQWQTPDEKQSEYYSRPDNGFSPIG